MKYTSITRDNFKPSIVLEALRHNEITTPEGFKLLEEACHALVRMRVQRFEAHSRARHLVECLDERN